MIDVKPYNHILYLVLVFTAIPRVKTTFLPVKTLHLNKGTIQVKKHVWRQKANAINISNHLHRFAIPRFNCWGDLCCGFFSQLGPPCRVSSQIESVTHRDWIVNQDDLGQ